MRRDQASSGEMKLALRDRLRHGWKLSRRARHSDPLVRHAFRKAQFLHTIVEHRRATLFEMQSPRFYFTQMCEEVSFDHTIALHQFLQTDQESSVAKTVES
jgi:hypothetical protein